MRGRVVSITRAIWYGVLCNVLSGLLLGCGGSDSTGPAPLTANQAFWVVRLNHHTVDMALNAPYDTLQLSTTAYNAAGQVFTGAGAPKYQALDSSVTITPAGLVTAHFETGETMVIVTVHDSAQNITLTDTVAIAIVATASGPLQQFSIAPADSAIIDAGLNRPTIVRAVGTAGEDVCNNGSCPLLLSYSSSDTTIAQVDANGIITAQKPGRFFLIASADIYGRPERDSVLTVVGYPIISQIGISDTTATGTTHKIVYFNPSVDTIGVGGAIVWNDGYDSVSFDVVFTDPSTALPACGFAYLNPCPSSESGNIPVTTENEWQLASYSHFARVFAAPGTYTFHSTQFTSQGTIVVLRNSP